MDRDFIKSKFLDKHIIDDEYYMDKYISFLLEYETDYDSDKYMENHHILPVCTFPEFKDENWNLVRLEYDHHRKVHLWLFKSINIREYQRPLNWMGSPIKNRNMLSKAAKRGWVNFKKDEVRYKELCDKRSDYMKGLSSDEQRRRANLFWDNITPEEYSDFCENAKNRWTEELRLEKSKEMKLFYEDHLNIERKSEESKDRWDSMSIEDRNRFTEKMTMVNRDENKRRVSGDKIKELWKDPSYLNKMKNRRRRSGTSVRVIYKDGSESIFETMSDLVRYHNFSPYYIRKYRDNNLGVDICDLNEDNMILLGSIIKTIKE